MQLPTQPNQKAISLFNPATTDYIFDYAGENNEKLSITLRSQEITTMPKYLADRAIRKLADMLVWKRGIKTNYEDEMQKTMTELLVDI